MQIKYISRKTDTVLKKITIRFDTFKRENNIGFYSLCILVLNDELGYKIKYSKKSIFF